MTNEVHIRQNDQGQWVCDPDPVKVHQRNVEMAFYLDTAGYSFAPTDAIVVRNGGDEFPTRSVTKTPTKAQLHNKNSARASFKYDVNLIRNSDGHPIVIDPVIDNEPRP
jgi:hypothetical protein